MPSGQWAPGRPLKDAVTLRQRERLHVPDATRHDGATGRAGGEVELDEAAAITHREERALAVEAEGDDAGERQVATVFGEHALPTKLLKDPFEFFAQRIKHASPNKKAIEAGVEPELRSPRKTSQKIASGSL